MTYTMIKGSEVRYAAHSIERLFLDRWSPRAMSGEPLPVEDLNTLFEAARWAPSSYNNQPWRILYARRDTPAWPLFFDLLVDFNKTWAANAAVLLLFVSKTTFDSNGKPSVTHSFDCGAAWENLALQASVNGLVAHGMEGFDYEKARTSLKIPDGFQVEAMVAIGLPGDPGSLPVNLQAREKPSDRRRIAETAFEGAFPA